MSGKRPKGSLYACRELMAAADSHAATKNGMVPGCFTPCPELDEEGSALLGIKTFMKVCSIQQVTEMISFTGYLNRSSNRGINPHALYCAGFMPRKCLNPTQNNSLALGCVKRSTSHAPSPRRQERDNKGRALGFKALSARSARGLGIVTRKVQDKTALSFWLGGFSHRARKGHSVTSNTSNTNLVI